VWSAEKNGAWVGGRIVELLSQGKSFRLLKLPDYPQFKYRDYHEIQRKAVKRLSVAIRAQSIRMAPQKE
jgi:hypothetical protein